MGGASFPVQKVGEGGSLSAVQKVDEGGVVPREKGGQEGIVIGSAKGGSSPKGPKVDEGECGGGIVISREERSLGWVVTFAKSPGGNQQRPTRHQGVRLACTFLVSN